ncbi:CML13, partial [Symbiodinium microadriaticum]
SPTPAAWLALELRTFRMRHDFQLLHAVEHCFCEDKVINYLVDGFHIAETLKKESREDFDMLSDGTSALIHITPHLEFGVLVVIFVVTFIIFWYAPALEPDVAAKFYKARSHILPSDGERWVQGCYIDRDAWSSKGYESPLDPSPPFKVQCYFQKSSVTIGPHLTTWQQLEEYRYGKKTRTFQKSPIARHSTATLKSLTSDAFVVPRSHCGWGPRDVSPAELFGRSFEHVGVESEDAEALAKEAAKLRAEAAELEAEQEELRRKERQALFKILDTDSSGALDAKELQKGVKDVMGSDVTDEQAERLVTALDLNGDGIIQPEELDFTAVQTLLREFRKEMQTKEEAERTAAYASTEEELLRKEWDEFLASRPARNEDTGLLTRIGSLLAYALPLTDALRFGDLAIRVGRLGWGGGGTERGCRRGVTCSWDKGHWLTSSGLAGTQLLSFKIGMFLFAAFPEIQPLLDFLVALADFAVLICLDPKSPDFSETSFFCAAANVGFSGTGLSDGLALKALATNRDLPALLRYNLRQDIFLVFMSLVGGLIQGSAVLFNTPLPLEVIGLASTAIYFAVTGACIYSIVISLTGKFPKGLGPITELAEFQIFDTAPSDGDEDTAKYFDQIFKNRPKDEEVVAFSALEPAAWEAAGSACQVEEAFILKVCNVLQSITVITDSHNAQSPLEKVLRELVDQEILKKEEVSSELESQLEALWDLCVDDATAQAVASSSGEGRVAEAALGAVANVCSHWVAKPPHELTDVGQIAVAVINILATPDAAVAEQALRIVFTLLCCTDAPKATLWCAASVERYMFVVESSLRWGAVRFACDALAQGIALEAQKGGLNAQAPCESLAALRRLGALALVAKRCEELAGVIEEGADGAEGDGDPETVLWSVLRLIDSLLTVMACSDSEATVALAAALAALRAAQRPEAQVEALEVISTLFEGEAQSAADTDSRLLRQASESLKSDADVVEKLVLLLPDLDEDSQGVALMALVLLQSARPEDVQNHAEAIQEAMASFSKTQLEDAGVRPAFLQSLV